ncbi:MAG: hypothetical protein J0L97_01920 [Alphaproteobacteria bacterium]|nr:hypothetical protein [Alphaproteobacteria bacterium]
MLFKLRLIPITIVFATLLLVVKVMDIMEGGSTYSDHLLIGALQAQSVEPAKTEAPKPQASATEEGAGFEVKPAESPAETQTQAAEPGAETPPAEEQPKREFTKIELDILQSLSKRREEIDNYARELDTRAEVLRASEAKIDQKIAELKDIKGQLDQLVNQYTKQEETNIRSLVKIYENMKPKEAARIFEEIDMPVLLMVVDHMQEKKVAPILANMNPQRAKQVTVSLAEMKKLVSRQALKTP